MAFFGISYRSFSVGRPTKGWTGIIRLAYPWRMRPLPPLSAVRVFEAAARLENFTAAAQALGMTQEAVSYQVKVRPEEHTSELQSLLRTSYAVLCLQKNIHLTGSTSTTAQY